MNASKIAVRYATALFSLALEKNALERVYRDMKVISRVSSMEGGEGDDRQSGHTAAEEEGDNDCPYR